MENVSIFVSAIGAWVNIDSEHELKRFIKFVVGMERPKFVKPALNVVKRYDYGGRHHGYNVIIIDMYDSAEAQKSIAAAYGQEVSA